MCCTVKLHTHTKREKRFCKVYLVEVSLIVTGDDVAVPV